MSVAPSNNINTERQYSDPILEAYDSIYYLEEQALAITEAHIFSTFVGTRDASTDIVMEGLGDFLSGAVTFFKNLISKLIEFFKQSSLYMSSLFGSFDKFLERNKDKLLDGNKEFKMYGYDYSFGDSIPKIGPMSELVQEFNKDVANITKLQKSDLVEQRRTYFNDGQLDKLRGEIIGKSGPIESSDFQDELKKIFRSGADSEKEIRVDKATLTRYINEYGVIKKKYEETRKDRNNLEKLYRSLETFFARGARQEYVGQNKVIRVQNIETSDFGSGEFKSGDFQDEQRTDKYVDLINYFYQFKWKQAQEIGTYSFQAYAERINAMREAVKFYEKVIRASVFSKEVEKGGTKNA